VRSDGRARGERSRIRSAAGAGYSAAELRLTGRRAARRYREKKNRSFRWRWVRVEVAANCGAALWLECPYPFSATGAVAPTGPSRSHGLFYQSCAGHCCNTQYALPAARRSRVARGLRRHGQSQGATSGNSPFHRLQKSPDIPCLAPGATLGDLYLPQVAGRYGFRCFAGRPAGRVFNDSATALHVRNWLAPLATSVRAAA